MRYSASNYSVTLKTGLGVVQGHWKWRRSHTTFYWSAIAIIALSATVFELFDVEWFHNLEMWVRGHSRSFKPVPLESLGAVSYSPSIVTMALPCIICEMKHDIGRKSWFFHTPTLHSTPLLGGLRRNIAIPFGIRKWNGGATRWWKKFEDMYKRLASIPACFGRTGRRTDRQTVGHLATA